MTSTVREDVCTFMTARCSLLRIRNVSHKGFTKNQNTFYVQLRFSENRAVYEVMWKNTVEPDRPQMTE